MKLKLLTRLRGALAMAAVALAAVAMAAAQAPYGYVTVSGLNILDSTGNPEANGTITFAPVNNAGTPIGYRAGVGYGAVLTVTVTSGSGNSCTVNAGGSGYPSAVNVVLAGGGGTGMTVVATVVAGSVTACSFGSDGSGYATAPTARVVGYGQTVITPVQANIVAGAWSMQIADTALTSPLNVCFAVAAVDNVSGAQLLGPGYSCVQPAGSGAAVTGGSAWCTASTVPNGGACNFDAYPPNLAALTVTTTGPAGPAGVAGPTGPAGPPGNCSSTNNIASGCTSATTAQGAATAIVNGNVVEPQQDLTTELPEENVLALGAVGNSSTDDTAAIQSAFPATCGAQHFAVYIPTAPGGSYKITAPVVVNPNCTPRIDFDGPTAALAQATANQDALQISCGTAGNCNTKGFVLNRPAVVYTGTGTTSGAGIRFTGVAPGLSPTPVSVPPATWNGDVASTYDAYSNGFNHGIEIDGWGNIKFYNPAIGATPTASAAQAISAGSCTGAGSGNCSVTVTSAAGYTTGSNLYITGASPTALPSFSSSPNLLDSPFGLLSIGAFAGGTVTGTVGQTCLVGSFINPTITGGAATVTLTANVTGAALTFANSNSVTVTNAGIALQGGGSAGTLSNGTASCTGTVFAYAPTIGQIPFIVTGASGNVITFTNPLVTTALTYATGGTNLPTAHAASPGSLLYITGTATNDVYIQGFNANCGGGVLSDVTAAIEWTAGGNSAVFDGGDYGNCDYLVLGQVANSATIGFGDVERQAGRYLQANGGGPYNVTLRNPVTAVSGPGSPIVSNGATGTLKGPHGFGGSTAAITANNCYLWTYTDAGDECTETTYGQTSSGQNPFGPMNYPSVIPTFSSAARDFLFWGADRMSAATGDILFVYRNISGSLTLDQLLFANSPFMSNPTMTGTATIATASITSATIATLAATGATFGSLTITGACSGCTTTPNATMIAQLNAPVNCTNCGASPGTQVASLTIPAGTLDANGLLHFTVYQSACVASATPDAACTAANTAPCELDLFISATNTGTSYHLASAGGTTGKEINFEIDVQALGATNSENINLTSINYASSAVAGAFAVQNPANINFANTQYLNIFLVDSTTGDRCVVPQANIKHWVG
jgi:hypothetical protein